MNEANAMEGKPSTMNNFRKRIYEYYVHARHESLSPVSIEGLKPRSYFLNKIIHDHFPIDKESLILDLGCGHGALVYFVLLAGYRNITGVDCSPQQVAEAKRLGIAGVHIGDLLDTLRSLPNESHDILIAFDIIEHFTKDELLHFVDEVHRVLRKGGKWIIHTPNGESPFAGRTRYGDFTHEMAFTRVSITQLLKSSGFSNVSCYEDTPIPHGFKSAGRWLVWKMIRGILRIYLAAETGRGERECIFTQCLLAVAVK